MFLPPTAAETDKINTKDSIGDPSGEWNLQITVPATCRVREGNLDTRGIWTLVMFKASNLFSLLDTQLLKTVPGSFDTCF